MPNQIDGNIKEERSNKLIELSNKIQNEYNLSYIRKKQKVLFEEKENNFLKGHTNNFLMINVNDSENFINQIKDVEIVGIEDNELVGKIAM